MKRHITIDFHEKRKLWTVHLMANSPCKIYLIYWIFHSKVYIYIYIYLDKCVYIYIYKHTYIYIYIYINKYIYIYIYIIIQGFRIIVSIFIFIFSRYALRPSSGVSCRYQQPTRNFELRPLFNPRWSLALIPLTIIVYKSKVFLKRCKYNNNNEYISRKNLNHKNPEAPLPKFRQLKKKKYIYIYNVFY